MSVGIDDIAVHIPRLVLDMAEFAALRGLDAGKLRGGLGLHAMAMPDVHEDPATMGANAVSRLIERNELDPRSIGRIYLGTESALDGAKPTATYILEMLIERFAPVYGDDCFAHCDVVDLTFACIGAVDALHNTLDWVRGDSERVGIVVYADSARYDRGSTGEYTQGAGGGALLVRHNPRLLAIDDLWGVCTTPVHDFFKPRRKMAADRLFADVLRLAESVGAELPEDLVSRMVAALPDSELSDSELFHDQGSSVSVHRDTPVFDGPLSNRCYVRAVRSAFGQFRERAITTGRLDPSADPVLTEQWRRIVVHLPYAYQGKRMFPDLFRVDRSALDSWSDVEAEIGPAPTDHTAAAFEAQEEAYRRALSKSQAYRAFAKSRLERGERASSLVGNQYTGSIFLALLSTLESDLEEGTDLSGARIGFCAYGSGAKAKVFEGEVQPGWRDVVGSVGLFERLRERVSISGAIYEQLHRGQLAGSIAEPEREFALDTVEEDGERRYRWVG
ncbi:MAG: hydroxymethylglutaryl-CoA synthase family protein [Proteobacteria bacterium]|nr:hydroxymethylglutaryl-CoA synthase family protein [Pseudomonadota bacterium]